MRTDDEIYTFALDLRQKLDAALKGFDSRIREAKHENQSLKEIVTAVLTGRGAPEEETKGD